MTVEPVYRTILVLDLEHFGRGDRDDQVRVRLRRALRKVMAEALGEAGVPSERYSTSDTGDGLLVLVDPAVPTARVVRAMLDLFAAAVAEHNRLIRAVAQLRVRAAIHAGQLLLDEQGATGEQLNLAFRLLDAPQLRARLAQSPAPTVVCVSDDVYREVVRQRHLWLDPETFAPLDIVAKETRARAWVHASPAAGAAHLDERIAETRAVIRTLERRELAGAAGGSPQAELRELYERLNASWEFMPHG